MTLNTTIFIVGTPAKPAPIKNIGQSEASPTMSGRTSMNTSNASIGSGGTLIPGATKAWMSAGKW